MADFKSGEQIKLTSNGFITVKNKIGEGGQGSVYCVDYQGKSYALKWYLPSYLKGLKPDCAPFYENLVNNVHAGAPSPSFLWMQAIAVTGKHSNGFGYIMELRPTGYEEFTKFIKGREHFSNTQAVITAAIQVVEAFRALHKRGYSYQDLSPGNFFINKLTGDVLICDNDNVAPNNKNLGVGGTPGYMAPEVILGNSIPSTNTDLFSLAVILFELFFLSHPLEGLNCCKHPCLTQQIEKELYAIHPVFVCSKTDRSNAPVRGISTNLMNLWPTYPEYLHEAFQQAFSETALKDGQKRPSEMDWLKVLDRLRDDAIPCPHCHEANFVSMAQGNTLCCPVCKHSSAVPVRITVNGSEIAAAKDKHLSEHQVNYGSREKIIGTFMESKKTSGFFGLRNDSGLVWSVEYPGKPAVNYEAGKTVSLYPGTKIHIGTSTVEVKN